VLVITVLGILICNLAVSNTSSSRLFNDLNAIPANRVGLVLGTSKYLSDGGENLYFTYRLKAAYQLWLTGKIDHIIVSGDNRKESYNEPRDMKRALVKLGVPANKIHLDYAGLRTLDSVVRCKKVFGQDRFTIISQKFQNERALFIARKHGIDAIAFNARDVDAKAGFKTSLREVFARVKVVLDLYVLNTQPKHLGEKEDVY
jgi:SanA protein